MVDSSVLPPDMPAHAGIHDLPSLQQRKSWIPAFAGMTVVAARASMVRAVGISQWINPVIVRTAVNEVGSTPPEARPHRTVRFRYIIPPPPLPPPSPPRALTGVP
jgi:hypothetical protein